MHIWVVAGKEVKDMDDTLHYNAVQAANNILNFTATCNHHEALRKEWDS